MQCWYVGTPSSVINTVFTVTETSTAGLNSTAQVRVTSDPKGGMGLGMLLDNATEVGAGTEKLGWTIESLSQPKFIQLPQYAYIKRLTL